MNQDVYHIDFETCSVADLRKTGAYKYARHPTTQVICMAYTKGVNGAVGIWVPRWNALSVSGIPAFLFTNPLAAWNVSFEAAILQHVLKVPRTHLMGWQDTMAEAAVAGLPLGLDLAAEAAGLASRKDKEGHALMMRMSRPRKHLPGQPPEWWHEQDYGKLKRLIAYCKQDVVVESLISARIERLSETEKTVWQIDFDMNARGVKLDTTLVEQMQRVVDTAQDELKTKMTLLTAGAVTSPSQTGKLMEWVNSMTTLPPKDLRRDTLEAHLKKYRNVSCVVTPVLETRLAFAKSSNAKLQAMRNCVSDDGAMRGLVQYYGAMRTGRFAGRLVQPQNMPRPVIPSKDVESATAYMREGMLAQGVRTFYGDPMEVVSSCLRSAFVARKDHLLFSVDFSQIEARALAWRAGQKDILEAFAKGEDVYTLTANKIGSDDRFLGKVLVLACGYQMGGPKFYETATKFGLEITEREAVLAVEGWRSSNTDICKLWRDAHAHLAKHAAQGADMIVTLKSGRKLPYRNMHFSGDGEISYTGLNTYTHKWGDVKIYGGKLVENVVQATARDIMTEAMIRVSKVRPEWNLIMTVHDELVYEIHEKDFFCDNPDSTLDVLEDLIRIVPDWADGLPVDVEGWYGKRYRK